jgi:hypothetical protein
MTDDEYRLGSLLCPYCWNRKPGLILKKNGPFKDTPGWIVRGLSTSKPTK